MCHTYCHLAHDTVGWDDSQGVLLTHKENEMEQMLSIDSVAELLSVSPWTVRLWIKQGKLGSAKLGTRRVVPQSEVERFVDNATVPAVTR